MAHLFLIPALLFAFIVLRGWPVEWSVWARAALALASLAAGLAALSWLTPSPLTSRFRSTRRPIALDWIAGGLALTLGLAILLFFLSFGPVATKQFSEFVLSPLDSNLAKSELEEEWGPLEEVNTGIYRENIATEVRTVFNSEGASVPSAVNISTSDKPEVSLKMETVESANRLRSSGAVYINSFSYNHFDGDIWTAHPSVAPTRLTQNRQGLIHLAEAPKRAPAFRYTILHGRHYEDPNTLKVLQGALEVRLPEVTRVAPSTFLLPLQHSNHYQYEVRSLPQHFENLLKNNLRVESGNVGFVFRTPTTHLGLQQLIQKHSEQFLGNQSTKQSLIAVQEWLRSNHSYSQKLVYPENGKCALENFLGSPDTGTNVGFCIHFASAAALLVRQIGVPSRVCYGWSGGQFYAPHNLFVFRGEHAHAWTEIFLKDHGWVIFETTPSSDLPRSAISKVGEGPPLLEEFLYENPDEFGKDEETAFEIRWEWVIVGCGTTLSLLVILLFLKNGKSKKDDRMPQFGGSTLSPNYLKLFLLACNRLGHPMPNGSTLLQHLDFLKIQGMQIQFAEDLLVYHYNITYRDIPRDPETEKRLCHQIRAW